MQTCFRKSAKTVRGKRHNFEAELKRVLMGRDVNERVFRRAQRARPYRKSNNLEHGGTLRPSSSRSPLKGQLLSTIPLNRLPRTLESDQQSKATEQEEDGSGQKKRVVCPDLLSHVFPPAEREVCPR